MGKTRNCKTKDTWYHTMRSAYDWRGGGATSYVDPFHIPVSQGGHAAHICLGEASSKDVAESEVPLHPRLRGLLLDEELEAEEEFPPIERGYRELLLFTHENAFMKTKDVGGPVRRAAQKEREFKRRERAAAKHLSQRAALSVKPPEGLPASPPSNLWSGRVIETAAAPLELPMGMLKSSLEKEEAQWRTAKDYVVAREQIKHGATPDLLGAPPLSQGIAPSVLQRKSPDENDAMQKILEKSFQDMERGFIFGGNAANSSAEDVPWYDQDENVSSMLILDQDSKLPSLRSRPTTAQQLIGVAPGTGI